MYLSNLILFLDRGPLVYQLYCYVPPSLNRVLTYLLTYLLTHLLKQGPYRAAHQPPC